MRKVIYFILALMLLNALILGCGQKMEIPTYSNQLSTSDTSYVSVGSWSGTYGSDNKALNNPLDIIVADKSQFVCVADSGNKRIIKFPMEGENIIQLDLPGEPLALAYLSRYNSLYVAMKMDTTFTVKWYDINSDTLKGELSDTLMLNLQSISGMVIDASGNIIIADYKRNVIERYKDNGEFYLTLSNLGNGAANVDFPGGIALDNESQLLITVRNHNWIQRISPAVSLMALDFGPLWDDTDAVNYFIGDLEQETGDAWGEFNLPRDVWVDKWGNIYIADTGNKRTLKFNSYGVAFPSQSIEEKITNPLALATDEDGESLYITDKDRKSVEIFIRSDVLDAPEEDWED